MYNKTFQEVLLIYYRTTTLRSFSKIFIFNISLFNWGICFSSTNMDIHYIFKGGQGINPKVCNWNLNHKENCIEKKNVWSCIIHFIYIFLLPLLFLFLEITNHNPHINFIVFPIQIILKIFLGETIPLNAAIAKSTKFLTLKMWSKAAMLLVSVTR